MILHARKKKRALKAWSGYAANSVPLKEYTILIGGLHAAVFLASTIPVRRGHQTLSDLNTRELVVLALAVHKLARLLAKDKVTAPLRAPFTRFEEGAGAGEVNETPRGEGLRGAIGELISCPYCTTPWAATALILGQIAAPKATRIYAHILALTAVGHFLNQAYARAKELNEQT